MEDVGLVGCQHFSLGAANTDAHVRWFRQSASGILAAYWTTVMAEIRTGAIIYFRRMDHLSGWLLRQMDVQIGGFLEIRVNFQGIGAKLKICKTRRHGAGFAHDIAQLPVTSASPLPHGSDFYRQEITAVLGSSQPATTPTCNFGRRRWGDAITSQRKVLFRLLVVRPPGAFGALLDDAARPLCDKWWPTGVSDYARHLACIIGDDGITVLGASALLRGEDRVLVQYLG